MPRFDLSTTCYGSIITLCAESARGRRWLRDNVDAPLQSVQIDCEHRAGMDIIIGALTDGLRLLDNHSGRIATKINLRNLDN